MYKTDYTNAFRTMLFNIKTLSYDDELYNIFNIDKKIFPEFVASGSIFGNTDKDILGFEVPICVDAGDQQAALFGQCCFDKGDLKITYGTGCFVLMNTDKEFTESKNGLITTLCFQTNETQCFVLEGSVFVGGV